MYASQNLCQSENISKILAQLIPGMLLDATPCGRNSRPLIRKQMMKLHTILNGSDWL